MIDTKDCHTVIFGGFLQHTSELTDQFSLETGLRVDHTQPAPGNTRWFWLPRVSALYRFNTAWSMRAGGGMGYKLPDMFTDEAENRAFQNVLRSEVRRVGE